jgi:hypothetical protein
MMLVSRKKERRNRRKERLDKKGRRKRIMKIEEEGNCVDYFSSPSPGLEQCRCPGCSAKKRVGQNSCLYGEWGRPPPPAFVVTPGI